MIRIEEMLKQHADVDDYRIVERKQTSYEVFFVHERLETVRSTDTCITEVTVYVRHDGKLGDSSFDLYDSMDEQAVEQKIQAAVMRARLVFNEPYELPADDTICCGEPSVMEWSRDELAARVADAVFAANTAPNGDINATEIFLYHDTVTVKNSRGICKTQAKDSIMIEAIPTWNEDRMSVELYENVKYLDFDAEAITAEIAQKMREVRDRQHAEQLHTPVTCNAALGVKEIARLLRSIAGQLNYQNVYSHANMYKLGDDLQPGAVGDRLTIMLAGSVPGGSESELFDADGVTLGEKVVVDNGVVCGYHGSSRYAQYLGEKEPTGVMNCIKAAPGTLTAEALEAAPYLEIVSMSGMQVDLYNDYLGGEIRLAYWHEDGEVRPVTGITMSASLKAVLHDLQLSNQLATWGTCRAPQRMLMHGVKVL